MGPSVAALCRAPVETVVWLPGAVGFSACMQVSSGSGENCSALGLNLASVFGRVYHALGRPEERVYFRLWIIL